jgi:formate hydrogenlyase subunit 6/NADH:ubiquinone oxidoreductase subunit I
MNIKSIDSKLCTGCGLCSNICPVNAIEMVSDKEGFLAPSLNTRLVTNAEYVEKSALF